MTQDTEDAGARVRASFARQGAMTLLGARIVRVAPGEVEIALPFRPEIAQQHGFFHGGVIAVVLDSACGFAAFSLMPEGAGVLTVEFKTSFLAAASGTLLRARGRVIRSGRTVTFCEGEAEVESADGASRRVATMSATMMTVRDRPGVVG